MIIQLEYLTFVHTSCHCITANSSSAGRKQNCWNDAACSLKTQANFWYKVWKEAGCQARSATWCTSFQKSQVSSMRCGDSNVEKSIYALAAALAANNKHLKSDGSELISNHLIFACEAISKSFSRLFTAITFLHPSEIVGLSLFPSVVKILFSLKLQGYWSCFENQQTV